MRIAAHHIPGTDQQRLSALLGTEIEYAPSCSWPADCTVQWGHGIIPAVPFFEAFPPGTFIRGEGASIAEAEQNAFTQYRSEFECAHVWGRARSVSNTYLNGAGWCRKCGAFRSSMFQPVVMLGHYRKPLRRMERDHLRSLEEDAEMNAIMARKYPEREPIRRKIQQALRLRLNLYGEEPTPC